MTFINYYYKMLCYIYAYSLGNEILYIGSTAEKKKRHALHKTLLKGSGKPQPFHTYLRENGLTFDDLDYTVIQLNLENKKERLKLERQQIEMNKPVCNSNTPGRTLEEWIEENKDKLKKYDKLYQEKNREKIKANQKIYRERRKQNGTVLP